MIICPSCKHEEYDGTLFCSECGARLWSENLGDDTANLGSSGQTDRIGTGALDNEYPAPPSGQIFIRIHGVGTSMVLTGKNEYVLGRKDPRNQGIPDVDFGPFGGQQMGVSRQHARLQYSNDGVSIVDLASTNGTLINSKLIAPNETRRIHNGDDIRLGKLAFSVYFAEKK
jgi:pSer/pThr/pTyr-binding forkhead associated (FHA) protein